MRLCAFSTLGLRLMPASRMRPSPLTNAPLRGYTNGERVREATVATYPPTSDSEESPQASSMRGAISPSYV